ncbi:helix-turn-helix transcriptional regulator [Rhodoferax antarcticus]|uniref:Transcriptional regulator, AlpA family n=1 Tax=Rhodoferax antarcticus ANT.BR TaxID=1111071 RepID=A0A1Q8YAZ2_9BURK|nr:AlpA family transcriptional regulator [Rhodoferax antarcticus]OLP05153.1 transcriptional regulator, AlpA family [Rhodoferax antarcticus ANT.BR]
MQTNPKDQPQPKQPTHGAAPVSFDGRVNLTPTRPDKLLRLPRVQDLTGFGKSSIYAGVKTGTFPAPVRLSARAVGWRESDIFQWIESRTATATKTA